MALYPGAPNLLKNLPRAVGITLLGNAVSALWNFAFPGAQWGIFKVGESVRAVAVTSVAEILTGSDSRVSDYPIQTGSFISYNKVRLPDIVSIRLTKEGNELERAEFLNWLDSNVSGTTVYDVVVPEWRYPKMTLASYRISRSASSGAALIVADCVFQQVRELPAVYSTTNIANPENQPATPTARGNVSLLPPEPASPGGPVSWQ